LISSQKAGHKLSLEEVRVRYDFTLMAMLRVWNAPWTPATHKSFQPGFQQAIGTFALCTKRLILPNEIVQRVGSFLNRSWWPDDRRQCWSHACHVDQVSRRIIQRKNSGGASASGTSLACKPCPGCGFSWYCSEECKELDYEAGHKYMCGSPLSSGTYEECELHREIFKDDIAPALVRFERTIKSEGDEPRAKKARTMMTEMVRDGSSKSMNTAEDDSNELAVDDDDSASSRTKAIRRYFSWKARARSN
jgi:hypothetical protein